MNSGKSEILYYCELSQHGVDANLRNMCNDTLLKHLLIDVSFFYQVDELRKGMVPPADEPLVKNGIKDGVWITNWC